MHIIINNSSMIPIYEQIVNQMKAAIVCGELSADTALPSVRGLANELKISALTVKKAYDSLEQEGFVVTVHGKGSFVAAANPELLKQEGQRKVEECLELAVGKAFQCGMSETELHELFEIVLEDYYDRNQ